MENFQKLNRTEMRNVLGGQPEPPPKCTVGGPCNGVPNVMSGIIVSGTCNEVCQCSVSNGGNINPCTSN